jgi:peptidoglycan hydrolase-like protein with peptidoglycan-binding domain
VQAVLPRLIGGGEPNVPAEFESSVCKRYLRAYIYPNTKNNPEEVNKLVSFLNENEGESLVEDGSYDATDVAAVKRFQKKYTEQILAPWGESVPNGRVYRTTAAKINLMSCAKSIGCPYFTEYMKKGANSLESVRIQDFLNLMHAPVEGYPTRGLALSKEFTKDTFVKLSQFQVFYKDTVLKPWKLSSPTGYFYKTTRYSANALMNCTESMKPTLE